MKECVSDKPEAEGKQVKGPLEKSVEAKNCKAGENMNSMRRILT